MKRTSLRKSVFSRLYRYRKSILILIIFILSFSLRAYDMGNKYPFGWDQVDNAWAAKNIIINQEFPLVGMVVKQNTGFFIGPIYYYYVAFFYWIASLNPAVSQYIALTTSVFTFLVIFFVINKLFNFKIALIASVMNTISFAGFSFDSVQWPVSFLPGISFLIFYFLYRLLQGEEKYIIFLAVMMGLAFHIHFTAVFFPIIILLCLPFFSRTKKMFIYSLISIPLFLIWFIPNLISQFQNSSQLSSLSNYLNTYYHGLHLKRFLQLTGDGLVQFDPFLFFSAMKPFKILILPIFLFIFLKKHLSKEKIILSYLVIVFFLVPWLAFSTYRGEISDYYFSINRFIALLILSYLLSKIMFAKRLVLNIMIIILLAYYSYQNLNHIFQYYDGNGLKKKLEEVASDIQISKRVEFQQGVPESYIYYYLMRKKGVTVY